MTLTTLLLAIAGIVIFGGAAVLVVALGMLVWRNQKPQPAVTWVLVEQPPPPPQRAPVACAPAAQLLIRSSLGNFAPLNIPPSGLTIGRTAENQLAINDKQASRCHARIECVNNIWFVIDLGSANGTLVNGVRVERRALRQNDQITIGQTTLTFQAMP